jgi:hypothetical protein
LRCHGGCALGRLVVVAVAVVRHAGQGVAWRRACWSPKARSPGLDHAVDLAWPAPGGVLAAGLVAVALLGVRDSSRRPDPDEHQSRRRTGAQLLQ